MAITILFDGLNQVGYSIAKALDREKKSFHRIGFDFDLGVMREARKAGLIEPAHDGLTAAAKADIVIIDQPADVVEEHYQIIGEVLRPKATLIDTSAIPIMSGKWAEQYIPKECAVVNFVPGMNAQYLMETRFNSQAAHEDLFQQSNVGIASPSAAHADGEAIAAALAKVLGATPLFMDAVELQVALAKTHLLPRLLSAALVNLTVGQPGWEEARGLAGADFARASFPALGIFEERQPGLDVLLTAEISGRMLDEMITELQDLREMLAAGRKADISSYIKSASDHRALWQANREQNRFMDSTDIPMPKAGDAFQQMFLGGLGKKRQNDD
ncbi:MAG: prephenate dehydrogenase/arogenate dehydrogenase family protein [Anaerolineae bacterium]|nr:prephenate dehydrogenase/arogenate dehydrogenase family protein [Anaerolineae bacterium]